VLPGRTMAATSATVAIRVTRPSQLSRASSRDWLHRSAAPNRSMRHWHKRAACIIRPVRDTVGKQQASGSGEDRPEDNVRDEAQRRMEDELKDPRTPFEYLIPRPLRLAVVGSAAASCFIACLLDAARVASDPSLSMADGTVKALGINLAGLALFAALFSFDNASAEKRVRRRKEIREAQIEFGDREVFVNESGQRMSKLKEVDDDWILRRLERWGQRDQLPLVGPKKGALLQSLVREKQPQRAVEVGSFIGYSAILMAQVLPPYGRLITIENDW